MNTVLAALVPIAFFGVVALSVLYADARLRLLFPLPSKARTRSAIAIVVFGALLGILLGATSVSEAAGAAYLVGGYVFTAYLYLILVLAVLHTLVQVWRAPPALLRVATVGLSAALTVYGAMQAGTLVVNEVSIQLHKLTRPVSVMLVSDVHLGHHRGREYLAKLVSMTNDKHPDLVLIAGDLVDADVALHPSVFEPLKDLRAPVFYVGGNHEIEIDQSKALQLIADQGVRVLHNEVVNVDGLQLVGLDYMKADANTFDMHPSADTRTIKDTLAALKLNAALPTILMHHSPVGVSYVEKAGADLMVAGHTHGGQLFPGTLITQAMFPFNHGLYRRGDLQVFVSKGAGTFLQRIRLGSENEINFLKLSAGS